MPVLPFKDLESKTSYRSLIIDLPRPGETDLPPTEAEVVAYVGLQLDRKLDAWDGPKPKNGVSRLNDCIILSKLHF
jgi:hypothetical protein